MKSFVLLSVLTAPLPVLAYVPVHGCEWVPETTAVTNFTFFDSPSNANALDYVTWQVPTFDLSCYVNNAAIIQDPSISNNLLCNKTTSSYKTEARFIVSADNGAGRNATVRFLDYVQCAADIYAFYYKGNFPLSCTNDAGGNATCISKGNATATQTQGLYVPLYPGAPKPPPPRRA